VKGAAEEIDVRLPFEVTHGDEEIAAKGGQPTAIEFGDAARQREGAEWLGHSGRRSRVALPAERRDQRCSGAWLERKFRLIQANSATFHGRSPLSEIRNDLILAQSIP
jgi:hypothetical protein